MRIIWQCLPCRFLGYIKEQIQEWRSTKAKEVDDLNGPPSMWARIHLTSLHLETFLCLTIKQKSLGLKSQISSSLSRQSAVVFSCIRYVSRYIGVLLSFRMNL